MHMPFVSPWCDSLGMVIDATLAVIVEVVCLPKFYESVLWQGGHRFLNIDIIGGVLF